MPRRKTVIISAATILSLAAGWYFLDSHLADTASSEAQAPPQPVPVTTVIAKKGTLPRIIAGIGVVQPLQSVTIRARIDGQVTDVSFNEGDFVHAGDVLVKLDGRALQAALDQAIAKKSQDEASLANAKADLDRYSTLADKQLVSNQDYDSKKSSAAQAEAAVAADDGAIHNAQTQLSYATIRAPISGRTGFKSVNVGSVVAANSQDGLFSITQLDPISVVFVAPGDRFGEIQDAMKNNVADADAIATSSTQVLAHGSLTVMDNIVNSSNGSVRLRATFDNSAGLLWPGLPVATRLTVAKVPGIIVPDKALARGTNGLSAYIVGKDNKAKKSDVKVSVTTDGMALVSSGLNEGDEIVFDGLGQIADGAEVHVLGPGNTPAPQSETATLSSGAHE